MATANPFDLLGDDENDDPSLLIAAQQQKIAAKKPAASAGAVATPPAAKLPSKPIPPAQAVRESRNNSAPVREGLGRGGAVRGRGGRGAASGQSREFGNVSNNRYGGGGSGGYRGGVAADEGESGNSLERGRGGASQYRGSLRGGRRGGYVNGGGDGEFNSDRPQRRFYERRSGTGIGNEMKRDGAGRGNWGTVTDEVLAQETEDIVNLDEKAVASEKQVGQGDGQGADASKDRKEEAANGAEEKEPEDNEMTLEEYEKLREEKRKALLAQKVEERKVELDKELKSMQQLITKKGNDDVFIKLGSDKDSSKRQDNAEKEERARKAVSINEFLKPAEGERYYSPTGRGRGRGRGDRGSFSSFRGGYTGGAPNSPTAPSIEDQGQFPTLGAK